MKKSKSFLALALCLCLFFECVVFGIEPSHVYADESLESKRDKIIASAVQYIESSQNEDGSFGDTFLINDTAEAAAVLSRFSDADVSRSLAWLKSQNQESNIDTLSRTIIADGDFDAVKDLLEAWNQDGGIGLSKEYSSDILDSILVLEAVNSLDNTYHNNTTWKIVTYIARQMNKDGSFSYTKNSDSNVILTSMALYTVGKYMSDNKITSGLTADMISKSTTYLQKKFDKTFPEETIEENIYIALALLENNALEDVEAVVNNLSEIQKDNGSFCDDVHLTSLAVWLLGKMDIDHMVQVYDMKMSNTGKAYYGIDTSIKVNYTIAYETQIDTTYQVKCIIKNGENIIYESDMNEITLSKKKNRFDGIFDGISIKENKDDGVEVIVQLFDENNIVKEIIGQILMENQPRAGETNIDDFSLELSDYYAFVGDKLCVEAEYKLLYYTNINNGVDMQVILTRDGNIIDEKNYSEIMIPEDDSIIRKAVSFEPDTSKEGKYSVIVRCLYEGELIAENSEDFCIISNPTINTEEHMVSSATQTDASQTDAPKKEREKIPFTVTWIGPKLSDYLIYAGKEKNISVSAGLIYYGDFGFKGNLKTEIIRDDSVIKSIDSDVDISSESNVYDISNITTFDAKGLGEYSVRVTLYDDTGKEISSGSKSLKIIDKKKIDLIADSSVSDFEDKTVDISWNDISNSQDTYNYRLYRRYDGIDWEPRSIWNEKDKIKVLNIYPYIPLLEEWMTSPIKESDIPAGMGMFEIDDVHINTFNGNPERYLLDENGAWKYDVLFFGSWDNNDGHDLTGYSADVVKKFVDSGRGALFGHDTVCIANWHGNFASFEERMGIKLRYDCDVYVGETASVVEYGTLTNFPWTLRGTLEIPECHSYGQYVGGNLPATEWMSIDAYQKIDTETNAHANAYLVTYNNLGLIQTGHKNTKATDDERKVLANTLFYLHQISQVTTAKDNSFYDITAPDSPDVNFTGMDNDKLTLNISSKDNGTKYQYYIEAISGTDSESENEKSNIMTHTALSGIDGYVYVVNESAEEDQNILEYDENHEKVLNIVKTSESDVLSTSIDIPDEEGKYYLHIFAIDKENNVSDERIIPLDEGMLTTSISTDKEEYLNDETVAVKSETKSFLYTEDGDVSVSLYDSEDNFVEEVYYENGQSVYKDETFSINTDIVLDETYEGEYTLKIEWENEDKVLCSDKATFKVKMVEDETIEEIVSPASPTDPDPSVPESTDPGPSDQNPAKDNPVKDPAKEPTNNKPNKDNNQDEDLRDNKGGIPTKPEKDVTTEVTTESRTTESKKETVNEITSETYIQEKKNTNRKAPGTGDDVQLTLLLIGMVVSLGAILIVIWRKKGNSNGK